MFTMAFLVWLYEVLLIWICYLIGVIVVCFMNEMLGGFCIIVLVVLFVMSIVVFCLSVYLWLCLLEFTWFVLRTSLGVCLLVNWVWFTYLFCLIVVVLFVVLFGCLFMPWLLCWLLFGCLFTFNSIVSLYFDLV